MHIITAITYNISAQIVLQELFAAISLLKLELFILYSTLLVSKMDLLFQLNFGRRKCTVLILTISESPSEKHGIDCTLADTSNVADKLMRTTAGSRILSEYIYVFIKHKQLF